MEVLDFKQIVRGSGGYLSFIVPMIDSANRPSYKTGLTVTAIITKLGYDGIATTITPTYTVTEIGSTGRYVFSMSSEHANNTIKDYDKSICVTLSATGADPQTQIINNTSKERSVYSGGSAVLNNLVLSSGTLGDMDIRNGSNTVFEQNGNGVPSLVVNFSIPSGWYPKYLQTSIGINGGDGYDVYISNANLPLVSYELDYEKVSDDYRSRIQTGISSYLYSYRLNESNMMWNGILQVKFVGLDSVAGNQLIIDHIAVLATNELTSISSELTSISGIPLATGKSIFALQQLNVINQNGQAVKIYGNGNDPAFDIWNQGSGSDIAAKELFPLNTLDSKLDTIDGVVDSILVDTGTTLDTKIDTVTTRIGTPVALSGGAATIASNLTKMADNANGLAFDSSTDSLAELQGAIVEGVPENEIALSSTVTSGVVTSGTYTDTHTKNDVYLKVRPDGVNVFDFYLEFQIEDKVPQSVYINGKTVVVGGGTAATNVFAYNWVTMAWQQISGVSTQIGESATDLNFTYPLISQHRENSPEGRVRIAFRSIRNNVADIVELDQVLVRAVAVGLTAAEISDAVWLQGNQVFYGAKVYIDTLHGTPGAVVGENGTPQNPVDNLDDAITIMNLSRFNHLHMDARSALTLTQGLDEIDVEGYAYTLTLNNQDIGNARITGARLIGTAVSTNPAPVRIEECHLSDQGVTLPSFRMFRCSFGGEITGYNDSQYIAHHCYSGVAGTDTPIFNFGTNSTLELRSYSGGMRVKSMSAGCRMSIEGNGQLIIDASCTGGTIAIRGNFTITDYSGGAVTISDDARFAVDQLETELADIEAAVVGAIPELTGVTSATPTLKEAIQLLHMALRNEKTQTTSLRRFTNDADTPICEADTTDNGSTFVVSQLRNLS